MRLQVDLCFLLGGDFAAGLIRSGVQIGPAPQARVGARGADELQHGLVTDQRLPGPVGFDMAEQLMLDWVPFGRATFDQL